MSVDKTQLYAEAADFFMHNGSVSMRLTSEAATKVCAQAADKGLIVARVEGGVWQHPGFGARLDCIWDGDDPPVTQKNAHRNNLLAAQFIEDESAEHDVFIITAPPITGWPHKL